MMIPTIRAVLAPLMAVALLPAACSSSEVGSPTVESTSTVADDVPTVTVATVDQAGDEPEATVATSPTSTAAPTAAAPTTVATETSSKPTITKPPSTSAPTTTVIDTNLLAGGSGCTPGTTQHLPDGVWYGNFVSATSTHLEFDLACWFYGDAATVAAAEDGEESPPPNDYYVRNNNPQVRTLSVGDGAIVRWMPENGVAELVEAESFEAWLADRAAMEFPELRPSIWVTLIENTISEIEEQFVP